METDPVFLTAEVYSFLGILLSSIIFTRLALKGKALGSFRFQLSIFILIWVVAEIPHILDTVRFVDLSSYETVGLGLHLLSMIAFAFFIGIKSIRFLHPTTGSIIPTPTVTTSTSPSTPGQTLSSQNTQGASD